MKSRVIRSLIVLFIVVVGALGWIAYIVCQNSGHKTIQTPPTAQNVNVVQSLPLTRENLLKLVNEERAKNGVAPLTEDARLDTSAQEKADDMAKNNYFGHENPVTGMHGYEYMNTIGISCSTDSENIVAANSSTEAVTLWDNSTSHHTAMIDSKYTTTGFGFVHVDKIPEKNITSSKPVTGDLLNSYVIVEHFCQP